MIPRSAKVREPSNTTLYKKLIQHRYSTSDVGFIEKIAQKDPVLRFAVGPKYAFKPPRTVVLGMKEPRWELLLLHEMGHAISGHKTFRTDVERLKMEVQAWEKAQELAKEYGVEFDEEMVQDELDTYRNWLHQKSRCPKCGLTRFQTPDSKYHCPRCEYL